MGRKKTGELKLFRQLALERRHVSFIKNDQGKEIPLFSIGPANCAHVLPKGSYPRYRLNPENIVFLTFDQHRQWDAGRHEIKDNPAWEPMFELFEKLKRQYYSEMEIKKY